MDQQLSSAGPTGLAKVELEANAARLAPDADLIHRQPPTPAIKKAFGPCTRGLLVGASGFEPPTASSRGHQQCITWGLPSTFVVGCARRLHAGCSSDRLPTSKEADEGCRDQRGKRRHDKRSGGHPILHKDAK